MLHEPIQLKGKIRMFEAFSGVGTQAMALKRITSNYEIVGYSEIDKYAIQSYHAIHGDVKAYGDITKMEKIPPCDIFTWSFPCTDLSKAGKQKGMNSGTRSGLVYEVLRLVNATVDKPKVLIMENVPDLIQANFIRQFGEIQLELERMGYMNYVETLNAKDFGVAQNRDRVFMVSVLGDYSYSFPNYIKLEKRLKDYLEDEVDEKYYLSAKFLDCMLNGKSGKVDRKKQFMHYIKPTNDKDIASTITTRETNVATSNFIVDTIMVDLKFSEKFQKKHQSQISPTLLTDTRLSIVETICLNSKVNGKQPSLQDKIYDIDGVSTAVTTSFMPSIAIPEATKQGYALAKDGDGVYLNRPHQKRGVVQDQMIQTIKTSGNDIGVVTNNLRIRKLTPLECWRLMGISDDDFNKAQASGVSNSQLYKQAGNAIVVDVFEAILRRMIT